MTENKILATTDPVQELRWNSLLELQVATFLPYELHFFLSSKTWQDASRVLDAGCGNGFFISRLRAFFAQKSFCGLDASPELIAAARENPALDGVEFLVGNLYDFTPERPFDAVIMRLVIQHMIDLPRLFDKLAEIVTPSASVFIIEPEPQLYRNYPETPVFAQMLQAYAQAAAQKKLLRADLSQLNVLLDSQPGWSVADNRLLVAPFTGPFADHPLLNIFTLWTDLFERSGMMQFDFDAARDELQSWARAKSTFSQLGIRIIEVSRVNS